MMSPGLAAFRVPRCERVSQWIRPAASFNMSGRWACRLVRSGERTPLAPGARQRALLTRSVFVLADIRMFLRAGGPFRRFLCRRARI